MKCRFCSDYIMNNGEMTKRDCQFPITYSSGLLCKPSLYFSDFSLSTDLEFLFTSPSTHLFSQDLFVLADKRQESVFTLSAIAHKDDTTVFTLSAIAHKNDTTVFTLSAIAHKNDTTV
ncbi:MAG: hypothetical protein WCH34_07775, partial [Bacteroidota bacterium]